MPPITRRTMLHATAFAGAATLVPPAKADDRPAAAAEPPRPQPPAPPRDRDFVIAAGMTDAEADAWAAIAEAAGKFFDLPEMHPMDRQEVASAVHVIQNKLLSRPTYRKYLELAKAAHGT